ncbi:DUF3189 family protein [Syntrophomonas wolfei]|uniref:Uncharacterized protein n=1 Tax=Syntrophomonas wolfei subsp. wolfei (strain DSM 2245B / Goettingen) TaxID=335541 RepID=Q0AXB1_SYNWW|nr:DUF3189 family protein [Syntrophomonas wolfei]ABI68643.1 hypothetical protein Swol_1335 [Syntrophomonas wolfei subsp. wolfei str. Goettingen G311]
MKIVFLGTTGVQHALIAAHIYLGQLGVEDFRDLEYYCDLSQESSGFPIFIGDDARGNQIYSLGVGKDLQMGQKTIENLLTILGFSYQDLTLRPVSIKAERFLACLGKIPRYLGGRKINLFFSDIILRQELTTIKENVEQFCN